MSQKAVEGLLGRLITDKQFRRDFYKQPMDTPIAQWPDVTAREIKALLALDESHIERLAKRLDPKIVRAAVDRLDPVSLRHRRPVAPGVTRLRAAK